MKKNIRTLFLTLAASFLFASAASALSYDALGDVYYRESDTLSPGLSFSELYSKNGEDKHRSFVLEYRAGQGTLPLVRYGQYLYGRDTLSKLIRSAEDEGLDVVGGVNGDFFSFQTGVPMSALIAGGRILSSDAGGNAFGVRANGSVVVGNPAITLSMAIGGKSYTVDHYNKYPTIYGVYANTSDYAATTKSAFSSREIVIALSAPAGMIGGFSGTVVDVRVGVQNGEIPANCMVLTIPDELKTAGDYKGIKIGETVSFSLSIDPQWLGVDTAVGGGDVLVKDGKICEGIADEAHEKQVNPRTAIGVKSDGTILVFAADGKQAGYSKGLTLNELAETMLELGCVTALNLDGGGSTTVAVKASGESRVLTVNRPSDGSERSLSNAILFANTLAYTGIPSSLKLSPNTAYVLKGSTLALSAAVRDTSYKVMEGASTGSMLFSSDSPAGVLEGNVFYANAVGEAHITASAVIGTLPLTGTATVTVVDEIDELTFDTGIIEIPSKSSYTLSLSASLDGIATHVTPSALNWQFEEGNLTVSDANILAACDIAYLDKNGVIHPNPDKPFESVKLTASYGEVSATVTITVGRAPKQINAMEYGFEDVFYTDGVSFTQAPKLVEGSYSLLFSGSELVYLQPKVMADGGEMFTMWVDSFPLMNECYVKALDADGKAVSFRYEVETEYAAIGLTKMKAIIPADVKQPLTLLSPFTSTYPVTIKLDAFTLDYGDKPDAFEDTDGHWGRTQIEALYETGISQGSIEDGKRYFFPDRSLTRAEFAKMLVTFKGIDVNKHKDRTLSFADTKDIADWALPYVRAAVGEGLMNGKSMPDGSLKFCPSDTITRTEVMYVFGSMMKNLSPATLTFADADQIPAWAREKLAIAYAAGVITGYGDNTLKPQNNITRGEMASVFYKMMTK